MDIVFFVISLVLAGFGGLLMADFLYWRVEGFVTGAMITGFQDKKNKGVALPIVSFELENGEELTAEVRRIDQFLFLLNRPEEDDPTTVIYNESEPSKVRVYGYIHLVAGVFLFAPLMAFVGFKLQSAVLLGQVSYVLVFGAITFGGWVLLKLIQKHY